MTGAGMTTSQIAALYALRQSAPVLLVEPCMRGWWMVTGPDEKRWLIDETGHTHRYEPTTEEAAA